MSELLLDRAGRPRSPATMPGFHAGRRPRNKGLRYPADPPKVEEVIAVMRAAGDDAYGRRLRGLIVILWRAGLRIQEALLLAEADLDDRRGALLVRRGKGGRRREVGMDAWGWGGAAALARASRRAARRSTAMCNQRPDPRPALVNRRRPSGSAQNRRERGRSAALRSPSAPARPCRRTRARGRAADSHPPPARPQQPRHHIRIPAGHRQRRESSRPSTPAANQ